MARDRVGVLCEGHKASGLNAKRLEVSGVAGCGGVGLQGVLR